MKPLDPRLLRYAKSSRGFLAIGVLLGVAQTAAMVGIAWAVARGVTGAIVGEATADLAWLLWLLLACILARGLCQWATECAGARAAAASKSELRHHLLAAVVRLGGRAASSTTEVTTLASHGLEALDSYFAKFLPQLLLTAIAMPLLLVVTFVADPTSAITEALTLPIIPVFMMLVGWYTQRVQRAQFDALTGLSRAFLEIIEGLSTLKIFGRARRQRDRIERITDDYRVATMKVLRVTFLSGFALELFASLAVALVAVQIGIRLIDRDMTLQVGLFALILAPEVFAPLRQVGAQFHAAAEGVEASSRVFALIASAAEVDARPAAPDSARQPAGSLELRDVCVQFDEHRVLDGVSLTAAAGAVTAIAGESGAGKSTLLGFIRGEVPGSGTRCIGKREVSALDAPAAIAWMGQSAGLLEGTIRENVALGSPDLSDAEVRDALDRAGAGDLDPDLQLGVGGAGLSGGQAQRVALARTLARARHRHCPVVLCDEPTSALDARRELTVVQALRDLADEGRVVVVVSHRRAVLAAADHRIHLTRARVAA